LACIVGFGADIEPLVVLQAALMYQYIDLT
jgi:hypothetical protein